MNRGRSIGFAVAALAAVIVALGALLEFLAPDVSYHARDRIAELLLSPRGRTFRIALGARAGSNYRVGQALNRHLKTTAGYELELLETTSPGNVESLLNPAERIDLATINSADDEAVRAEGVYGLAALELQHFFVVVANDNPAQDFRDLAGPVNPGVRDAGDPPTLGERIAEYYGMLSASADGSPARVSIVRPRRTNLEDLDSGHNVATTRTQFLRSDLIERMLRTGQYRLLPIRDHQALATLLPGTIASFIPAGLYGPGRRIPAEPVPTIAVRQLLVARADVPGRVVRDLLEVIYNPRFQREIQYLLTEASGRDMAGLQLHPAATVFYARNDALTADRLGRLSFVASAIAGLFAAGQFAGRYRREARVRRRRRRLADELSRLDAIRERIIDSADEATAREAVRDADALLLSAERDAAMNLLDVDGIQAVRSFHRMCEQAANRRTAALDLGSASARRIATESSPVPAPPDGQPGSSA